MTLRWTSAFRPAVLRLGNDVSRRCFTKKVDKKLAVTRTSSLNKQFNIRTRTLLLNYINHLYRGHDKRLKCFQSAMDVVQKAKTERGPFESLDDLTTKACLSAQEAIGLCEEIVQTTLKKRRNIQFSYPAFTADNCGQVANILAIHSSLYCVVWAQLEKTGRVLSWHKETLALEEKQKHTIDAVQAVMNFCNKIPIADAYIMETPDIRRTKDISEANDGFLLSTINCSILTSISCFHAKSDSRARIYYMNRTLVPLLFGLSVGMETVSRFRTVEDLIAKKYPLNYLDLRGITLDDWLRDLFTESNDKTKEELSIPLLAAMAAMEILVRQNPLAIEKVITS